MRDYLKQIEQVPRWVVILACIDIAAMLVFLLVWGF